MRLYSVCANASVLRIFSHTQQAKWIQPANKILLFKFQVFQPFNESTSRIICTDSNLKSYSYALQVSEKKHTLEFHENFLKENFNISDARYLQLVALPKECNNLDELLWTNEFKYILSRSPFLYDSNFLENSALSHCHFSTFDVNDCNDIIICNFEDPLTVKSNVYQCDKVYLQKTEIKENENGRPSEEQLLLINDRLIYSIINFFEKPQDFSIYHKNIVFQNNIKGYTIRGINSYIQTMYLMRFYGYLHFAKVKVEVLKVTHHIEDGTIRVRWRVNGFPRHKMLIMLINYKSFNWKQPALSQTQWLDGFSIFSVDKDGLIYKHLCDKMIPDDDTVLAKKVDIKSKLLGLFGLAPRSPAAGTLNALISCCKTSDISCKKLT